MLVVAVELLHGTIRAGSPEDTALTGFEDPGEWPPSPARLFSALVAADGTGPRMSVTDGSGLRLLEAALPPAIEADDLDDVLSSPAEGRYVVVDKAASSAVQEYPGRSAQLVRPSSRLCPRSPTVFYRWSRLEPTPQELEDLRGRAARIGYLGCADSPVRVTVTTQREEPASVEWWEPGVGGSTYLPIPTPGLLSALDAQFERFSSGELVRRAWVDTDQQCYFRPGESRSDPRPTTFWMLFDRPLGAHQTLIVAETLRSAVLDRYPATDVPPLLHGHGFAGRDWQQARYLPLPNVGGRRATGEIFGAAVWLPAGTDVDVLGGVKQALAGLRTLHAPGRFERTISFHPGRTGPFSAARRNWERTATRWASATPVVFERFLKRPLTISDVQTWCDHAGLPVLRAARWGESPFVAGGIRLHPRQVHRESQPRYPFTHVDLIFEEPVTGPCAIGRSRHFGLGILAPLAELSVDRREP